jgi:hypothetical protein
MAGKSLRPVAKKSAGGASGRIILDHRCMGTAPNPQAFARLHFRFTISHDEVAGFVSEFPDRLLGIGSADISKPMKAVAEIRRCLVWKNWACHQRLRVCFSAGMRYGCSHWLMIAADSQYAGEVPSIFRRQLSAWVAVSR